jgi:transcriptional regulator with XRE-family HTH domain
MARGRKERELPHEDEPASWLGATVREWRRRRELSVTDLAVRAGFGPSGRGYISKIEHGKIERPNEEHLRRIATALEVDAAELLARAPAIRQGDPSPASLATSLELLQRKLDAVATALGVSGVDTRGRRLTAPAAAGAPPPPTSAIDALEHRLERLALHAERTERSLSDVRQLLGALLRALGAHPDAERTGITARAAPPLSAAPVGTPPARTGYATPEWPRTSVAPMPRRPEPRPLKPR